MALESLKFVCLFTVSSQSLELPSKEATFDVNLKNDVSAIEYELKWRGSRVYYLKCCCAVAEMLVQRTHLFQKTVIEHWLSIESYNMIVIALQLLTNRTEPWPALNYCLKSSYEFENQVG